MPQNIGDNAIDSEGIARITQADATRLSKYLLRSGDIVYSRRGDVEKRAWVRPENDGWLCGTGCLRIRIGDESSHDSRFVSYLLGTEESRGWITRHAVGATMPNLNTSILSAVPLMIPPPLEQRAIAEVLGALDDKIAANTKLVSTSDSLARAEFSRMLDNAEALPLTRIAQFVNGRAFTKGASGNGRVVVRISELNSGIGSSTVYNDIDVAEQHVVRPGELLFAWSGSLTLHRWYRPEAIVNQHIFKVIPLGRYPVWCIFGLIDRKLERFKSIAADKATTMGHIQRRHLEEPVGVPAKSTIEQANRLMQSLWDRSLLAEQESLTLTLTRDTLLPQLMAGKIRVKDAEQMAEKVL